ncbi:MAG: hypothetical protein HOK54_10220 [Alphaproteobacteria bacterium]|nr:hypothetical protein [Alphaproteobacteria bacterium]
MMASDKLYIPVCLYPHTSYRTKAGVEHLMTAMTLGERDFLIVIADHLLALDRIVTGRVVTEKNVYRTARRDAEQVYRLIRRTLQRADIDVEDRLQYWAHIGEDPAYGEFSSMLRDAVSRDSGMTAEIDRFVDARIKRYAMGSNDTAERAAQLDYLMSEVCMSVYCSEILGYETEVWERPPKPEVPDPLKVLYASHRSIVEGVIGKSCRRELVFLHAS